MAIIQTIAKVFGLSIGIACLIKYGISRLTIPSSPWLALWIVIAPTIVMMGWLVRSHSRQAIN